MLDRCQFAVLDMSTESIFGSTDRAIHAWLQALRALQEPSPRTSLVCSFAASAAVPEAETIIVRHEE